KSSGWAMARVTRPPARVTRSSALFGRLEVGRRGAHDVPLLLEVALGAHGVALLSVEAGVEALGLDLGVHAKTHGLLDELEDDEGDEGRVGTRGEDADDVLDEELDAAEHEPVLAACVPRRRGEDTRQDRARRATDAVHTEGVEGVVVAELALEHDATEAERAADEAHDERAGGTDEARGRSDDDETRDETGCRAEGGGLAVLPGLEDQPREDGCTGGDLRVEQGETGQAVRCCGAARVEAEPAEPQEA